MLAAQDQARKYEVVMVKKGKSKNCRIGDDRDETETHLISECEKLAKMNIKKYLTGWYRKFIGSCVHFIGLREVDTGMTTDPKR